MKNWIGASCVALVLGSAGCGSSTPGENRSTRSSAIAALTASPVDDCPLGGCGTNGVWLGENLVIHEIDTGPGWSMRVVGTLASMDHLHGIQRVERDMPRVEDTESAPSRVVVSPPRGLRYLGFERDGKPLELVVRADELIGKSGNEELIREALRGAVIKLRDERQSPAVDYSLKIEKVENSHFWTSTDGEDVPLYTFSVTNSENPNETCRICDANLEVDDAFKGKVVIFEGDRYRYRHEVEEVGGNTSRFNIACAGTAISKLHLLRHTWAAEQHSPHVDTTVAQRETLLRLLTADYCGTGQGFTVDGHPLKYTFNQSWQPRGPASFKVQPGRDSIEALWGPDGAICLGTPRMYDRLDPERRQQLDEQIARECRKVHRTLRRCTNSDLADLAASAQTVASLAGSPWPNNAYAISVNSFGAQVDSGTGSSAHAASDAGGGGSVGSRSSTSGKVHDPWHMPIDLDCTKGRRPARVP